MRWIPRIVVAGLLATVVSAAAQPFMPRAGAPTDTGAVSAEEYVAPESPRASLTRYIELCRAGRYDDAAHYLTLPATEEARGPELARRLKAVLDRHVWFDFSLISPLAAGDTDDGLPAGVEEIAKIPGAQGSPEPVRLTRRQAGERRWVFSATPERIDAWFSRLENRWALEHLPPLLLRPGPRDLLYWQWLALPILFLVALGLGYIASRLTRYLLGHFTARTGARWDDTALARAGKPLTFIWALAAASALSPLLGLYDPAEKFFRALLRAGFLLVLFWGLARAIDVARHIIAVSPWGREHASSRSLLPLLARIAKVALFAVAGVTLLSELGFPVTSLIAGLGIGGLVLALAAQKTVENLFGAISIGADQPFREGDFVRVEDFVGTVEKIGLRSTRIRTLDRTVISIPNGKLADMRLESLAVRDRMRLACTIGLVYGTTESQMREVLEGFERILRSHPHIWPDSIVVRFKEFGDSSLNIEVMAWFQTPVWSEFQLMRQEVLLQFMEVVEKAGSSFAFPTRTVHLVKEDG
jgi:MscS family membrane protein